jgi:hypothetical protein
MFHSQHEIEKYLIHFFQEPGFFLEIGCWDGELISQTVWLERARGWSGVCVDPFPGNFRRRKCRVVKKAVSGSKAQGVREFVKVSIDRRHGGDVSYFSGFRDAVKTHWALIEQHCDYEIVQVETITMTELYTTYSLPNYIEFLSVDTEGSELEIFESIDFDAVSFGLIVFEHNEDEEVKRKVGEILQTNGYGLIASLRCDDIYINRGLL